MMEQLKENILLGDFTAIGLALGGASDWRGHVKSEEAGRASLFI